MNVNPRKRFYPFTDPTLPNKRTCYQMEEDNIVYETEQKENKYPNTPPFIDLTKDDGDTSDTESYHTESDFDDTEIDIKDQLLYLEEELSQQDKRIRKLEKRLECQTKTIELFQKELMKRRK